MKAKIYIVVALVTMGFLGQSNEAEAFTVAALCVQNPVPPPTIPYQNAYCDISWGNDGTMSVYVGSEASVQYWPGGGAVIIKDVKETGILGPFGSAPAPHSWAIACSDISGSFRLYGSGWSYRRHYVNRFEFYHVSTASASDAVFTYIYEPPNVPCN